MDYAACHVVYVDRAAHEDRLVRRENATGNDSVLDVFASHNGGGRDAGHVSRNLDILLGTFSEVHLCSTGKSAASKITSLNEASIIDLIPILVLIDIPFDDELENHAAKPFRSPSPSSRRPSEGFYVDRMSDELYGLSLLQWVVSEMQYQSLSKLTVPVAIIATPDQHSKGHMSNGFVRPGTGHSTFSFDPFASPYKTIPSANSTPIDQVRTLRYLDVGAVDVLTSPLLLERLPSLAIHAYRAHKEMAKEQKAILDMKRGRKRSWVGLDDQKPYAYLREAMVSGLMDGICKLESDEQPMGHSGLVVESNRKEKIAAAVGSWHFSAHDFSDDELLYAATLMFQHALVMPELEKWRITTESITGFLVSSRSAYNSFVPYHNFRHVVDVLQATFCFLVHIGTLPSYPLPEPGFSNHSTRSISPLASLLRPFDALTLLITAIGHDVGHPGVNNAFLVTLNAPLAQLYNDKSVLESFHCAAYSQILRRHWPAAFQDRDMRALMISSILATDMGLHFDYMKRLGFLQEKLQENDDPESWNGRMREEQRALACSLIIKCADISNVARQYDVASQWTMILTDEFARQASMEEDLGIKSTLFAAPTREILDVGKSQLGFMNMFAIPLFQGVTDVMPAMQFCVDELQTNKTMWEKRISDERDRLRKDNSESPAGIISPHDLVNRSPALNPRSSPNPQTHEDLPISDDRSGNSLPINRDLPKSAIRGFYDSSRVSPHASLHSPASTVTGNSARPPPMSSHVERSYATASAPVVSNQLDGYSSHNSHISYNTNGNGVGTSLVTDTVVHDEPLSSAGSGGHRISIRDHAEHAPQRSSDTTTDASTTTPGSGDWASQATSATTSKIPYSPSTQGTSVMSGDDYQNGLGESSRLDINSPPASRGSLASRRGRGRQGSNGEVKAVGVTSVIMETKRTLKTKTSRFKLASFWKRHRSRSAHRGADESTESVNTNPSSPSAFSGLPHHALEATATDAR